MPPSSKFVLGCPRGRHSRRMIGGRENCWSLPGFNSQRGASEGRDVKRRGRPRKGDSAGGEWGDAAPLSETARREQSREAGQRMVAHFLGPRDGPRTDGAAPEIDYLEALYRDVVSSVFDSSPVLRVSRPDGVAVGLRDPRMAMMTLAPEFVRAARDASVDLPYRERATLALAIVMVMRSALPRAEGDWRAMRKTALRVPEDWEVEQYRRATGSDLAPWPAHLVLPDVRSELEGLAADASLSRHVRDLAGESMEPLSPSEYLGFTRRCRAALAPPASAEQKSPRTVGKRPALSATIGFLLTPQQRRVLGALRDNFQLRKAKPAMRRLALDAHVRFEDVARLFAELKERGFVVEAPDGSLGLHDFWEPEEPIGN